MRASISSIGLKHEVMLRELRDIVDLQGEIGMPVPIDVGINEDVRTLLLVAQFAGLAVEIVRADDGERLHAVGINSREVDRSPEAKSRIVSRSDAFAVLSERLMKAKVSRPPPDSVSAPSLPASVLVPLIAGQGVLHLVSGAVDLALARQHGIPAGELVSVNVRE